MGKQKDINFKYVNTFVMTIVVFVVILFFGRKVYAATAVEENGALAVSGTKLVSKASRKEVCLRGVSTHGINWDVGYPYISKKAFQTLRDKYGVNAVRLAMYTTEYYGYCDKGSASESLATVQKTLKERIHTGVTAATDLGMYVIIDWHVLNDQNPNKYKAEAKSFFKEMSDKYKSYDNVIYEICNEPNGGTSWSDIKAYAKEIIPIIRANDEDAIIIVGTPNWSQDVDVASKSPLNYSNIMYTLHFYSATHKDFYRDKLKTALSNGLPVMVTEYGVSEASGDGNINTAEAKKWLDLLDANKISYFAWSLSNKAESASLLKAGISKKSGWTKSDLSKAGTWILGQYQKRSGDVVSKPIKVSGVKLKNVKSRKVKITYNTVSDATGYEISYSSSKNFSKSKTKKKKLTKTNYVVKKLKKGKIYYVRVRAYKKVDGIYYYGPYSTIKKIKIVK